MTTDFYAITNESDNGLFWSSDHGWVDTPTFDLFTREEREAWDLPIGGRWVQVTWKEDTN